MDYLSNLTHKEAGLHANSNGMTLSQRLKELEAISKKYDILMGFLSEEDY